MSRSSRTAPLALESSRPADNRDIVGSTIISKELRSNTFRQWRQLSAVERPRVLGLGPSGKSNVTVKWSWVRPSWKT
jgi:hypothetical protein